MHSEKKKNVCLQIIYLDIKNKFDYFILAGALKMIFYNI